jgi:PAS domain S-box-containing protein
LGKKHEELLQVIRDLRRTVAELERTNVEFDQLNKRYKTTLDCITDGFVTLDKEWRYTYVNESATRLLQRSRKELLGRTLWEDFTKSPHPKFYTEFTRSCDQNTPVHFDQFYPEPLNRWFECHCYPQPEGLAVCFQDVTESKKVEAALAKYRDQFEHMVKERTAELAHLNEMLEQEVTERKKTEAALEVKSRNLEEVNTALRVLQRQREEDKKDMEERFVLNVKKLVLPYVEKIERGRLDARQNLCVGLIKTNLNEVISPLVQTLGQFNLSPRETEILSLIKDGKTTKEIAEITGVATSSIDTYRNKIRTKLTLKNKKVNLQSYVSNLSNGVPSVRGADMTG